jgi:hypothetical protein
LPPAGRRSGSHGLAAFTPDILDRSTPESSALFEKSVVDLDWVLECFLIAGESTIS